MGFLNRFFGKNKTSTPNLGPKIDKLYTQAKALALAGEFPQAAQEFARLVAIAPTHAEARYAYARTLARAGDRSRAALELIESLRLSREVEDPNIVLEDAENLGIVLTQAQQYQVAAALTAGMAEGRFILLHEEPFDEEALPVNPEGLLQSVAYRQARDLSPFEASLSIMALRDWQQRDTATACLIEEGLDRFLARYESGLIMPRFMTCYKLTDLRKYLRRAAQNPIRGTDELFYEPQSVAIIDPLRRSIPLLEDRPIEESLLKWFAFRVNASVGQWPDRALIQALSDTYEKNGDETRAALAIKRLSVGL
jgi:tetratricopeptide (TPR) repeat protein